MINFCCFFLAKHFYFLLKALSNFENLHFGPSYFENFVLFLFLSFFGVLLMPFIQALNAQ